MEDKNERLKFFTVVGSFTEFCVNDGIDEFLKEGVLIDRRYGNPMEMDAYSIYNTLKFEELFLLKENTDFKVLILQALLKRRQDCGGFWIHNAWEHDEVHLRFTAAGIKLLVELINDGLFDDFVSFNEILNKHLSYHDKLDQGVWFLHDSIELKGEYHDYYFPNNAFGSSVNNMLILNTHLDTLNTLGFVLLSQKIKQNFSKEIIAYWKDLFDQGIQGLQYVIENQKESGFYKIDPHFRNFFIKNRKSWLITKIKEKYFYRFRLPLKSKYPVFFHPDGYTEREIGLAGVNFNYHLINLSDISKLIITLKRLNKYKLNDFVDLLEFKVKKGIDFIVTNTNFQEYLRSHSKEKSIELCEVIAMTLHWVDSLPNEWVQLYFKFRDLNSPTPGLKGYDGFFNNFMQKRANLLNISVPGHLNFDLFIINDYEIYSFDLKSKTYSKLQVQ